MNLERRHATGTISVRTYEPAPYDQPAEGGPVLSRIHVEEEFSGDIEGTGVVEFLQAQVSEDAASFVGPLSVNVRRDAHDRGINEP